MLSRILSIAGVLSIRLAGELADIVVVFALLRFYAGNPGLRLVQIRWSCSS